MCSGNSVLGSSTTTALRRFSVPNAEGFIAVLNSVIVDSTGDKNNPKTYTLTAREDTLELNDKKLGPADVNLISVWFATDAGAAIASIDLSSESTLHPVFPSEPRLPVAFCNRDS